MAALLENWRKVFPEENKPEEEPNKVAKVKVVRKDSFDRFGDDLAANILSYLPRLQQYRYSRVCQQWLNCMFEMEHFATLPCPKIIPGFWHAHPIDGLQRHMRDNENKKLLRLDVVLSYVSLVGLSEVLINAPHLRHLKIEVKNLEYFNGAVFAKHILFNLNYTLLDTNLEKLSFAIPLIFESFFAAKFFVERFGPILAEMWIDCQNDSNIIHYLIRELKNMPKLESLVLFRCGNKLCQYFPEHLAKSCPNLKRICLNTVNNGLFNKPIDVYFKLFPKLKYLLIQKSGHMVSISDLRKLVLSTHRCQPATDILALYKPPYQRAEMVFYSTEYKFMLATVEDDLPIIPRNTESLVFMDRNDRVVIGHLVSFLTDVIQKSAIRKLIVSQGLYDAMMPLIGEKAKKSPTLKHLCSHNQSPWLWNNEGYGANFYSTYLYVIDQIGNF